MTVNLVQIRELAAQKEDENWKFRGFLKTRCKVGSEEIDRCVFAATERVWAGIDCTTCANCCRHLQPEFDEGEVDRVARRLGMERQKFIDTYLERTDAPSDKPWQTRTTPCPFLRKEDNLCSIYEDRPTDCSGYPYLYKPEFESRSIAMIQRTSTCPIVYEVMEDLKKSLGFVRRSSRKG